MPAEAAGHHARQRCFVLESYTIQSGFRHAAYHLRHDAAHGFGFVFAVPQGEKSAQAHAAYGEGAGGAGRKNQRIHFACCQDGNDGGNENPVHAGHDNVLPESANQGHGEHSSQATNAAQADDSVTNELAGPGAQWCDEAQGYGKHDENGEKRHKHILQNLR